MVHIGCLGNSLFYSQCLIGYTHRMLSGETTSGKVRWWYIAVLVKGRSWSSWALSPPASLGGWQGLPARTHCQVLYFTLRFFYFFFSNAQSKHCLLWRDESFQAGFGSGTLVLRKAVIWPICNSCPCHPRDLQVGQAWAEFPLGEVSRSS